MSSEETESIGFRVRPSHRPGGNNAIAHFYSASATSSFMVVREQKEVSIYIVDRNLQTNDDTYSVTDEIRHSVIGMAAINGFSKNNGKIWQKG